MGDETKKFRNKLKEKLPQFIFYHIESPLTAVGYPDVDYLFRGSPNITGKIELKYSDKKTGKIDLRREQVVWLRRHARNGGRCFVAIKVGRHFIYVWDGSFAQELRLGLDIWELPHFEFNLLKGGWIKFGLLLSGSKNV